MYNTNQHIHFVGIGGIGMSGIAELLLNLGYSVSGSDQASSTITERLSQLGARVHCGHQAEWVEGATVVVTSSAIAADNPEVVKAVETKIPVIQRAEMLAELMRLKTFGIAVAGSHGKTSTTSMVGHLLGCAGLDPTIVVGGKVDSFGGNACLGDGDFLVAEADESDGSFLKLSPVLEVVTNIDLEHLDHYRDLDHIKETFLAFIDKIPFYGAAIVCLDDENVASILPHVGCRVISYGFSPQADIVADCLRSEDGRALFRVRRCGEVLGEISLFPAGRHNVQNALAAVAIGLELEIEFAKISEAFLSFGGVHRRMERKGDIAGVQIIDDYGHHPTEIRATLAALKETWPEKRLVVLFQPHRYSRTRALFEQFATCFHQSDYLVMTDIYAASEQPIPGVSSEALLHEVKSCGHRHTRYIADVNILAQEVVPELSAGDILLTLGAGDIVRVGEEIHEILSEKLSNHE